MWSISKSPRVEDPARLQRFLNALDGADWRNAEKKSLEATFAALNELVHHELVFYYKARKQQRLFSILTRGTAVLLGTVGVMIPLLAGANPQVFGLAQPYGYPLLVAAGAVLLVNRMFGATGGHIRYVTAQLELERIVTKFRLAWLKLLAKDASCSRTPLTADDAFLLMNAFVDDAYRVIQEETSVWGKSVSEALREYERTLPPTSTPAPPVPGAAP